MDTNERNVRIYADSSRRYRIRWNGNPTSTSITPSFSNTKALDVYGGQDASRYNTNVQIYRYNRGGNQLWEFEEAILQKSYTSQTAQYLSWNELQQEGAVIVPISAGKTVHQNLFIDTVQNLSSMTLSVSKATLFSYYDSNESKAHDLANGFSYSIENKSLKFQDNSCVLQQDQNVLVSPAWVWDNDVSYPGITIPSNSAVQSQSCLIISGLSTLSPFRYITQEVHCTIE